MDKPTVVSVRRISDRNDNILFWRVEISNGRIMHLSPLDYVDELAAYTKATKDIERASWEGGEVGWISRQY